MKRLTLLLIVALLTPTASARGSAPETTWTASASQPRNGSVTITRPVTFKLEQLDIEIQQGRRPIESLIAISGRYGGLIIRDSRGMVRVGVMRYRTAPNLIRWGTTDDDYRQILAPGHYTVTLFTDKQMTIRLPVTGGGSRQLATPSRARVQLADITDPDATHAMLPAASLQSGLRIGPRSSYVVLAATTASISTPAAVDTLCLNRPANHACLNAAQMSAGSVGGLGTDSSSWSALFGWPGLIPAGNYDARFVRAEAAVSTGHALFTVVFD